MLRVTVPTVVLNQSEIVTAIREVVATKVPKHVWVERAQVRTLSCSTDEVMRASDRPMLFESMGTRPWVRVESLELRAELVGEVFRNRG